MDGEALSHGDDGEEVEKCNVRMNKVGNREGIGQREETEGEYTPLALGE